MSEAGKGRAGTGSGPNRRLFVALDPPEAVRRRLGALATELRRAAGSAADDVRWVPSENVHLTLQFLGAVPEDRIRDVTNALRSAAEASRPLSLEVRGAGGFPNARRARVIWAGIAGEAAALEALARDIGRRLAPLGFPPEERVFSSHLTLGRARDRRGAAGLAGALASAGEAGTPWRATEVVLFESHLSPKGPRYEAVARVALGPARPPGT